jgi:hypothetical protein
MHVKGNNHNHATAAIMPWLYRKYCRLENCGQCQQTLREAWGFRFKWLDITGFVAREHGGYVKDWVLGWNVVDYVVGVGFSFPDSLFGVKGPVASLASLGTQPLASLGLGTEPRTWSF